jgi:hypothetical protein
MTSKRIQVYEDALLRLIESGKRISFDAVALEAGRDRGAIKGNEPEIIELKNKITEAKNLQKLKNGGTTDAQKNSELLREIKELKGLIKELKEQNAVKTGQINSLVYENHRIKNKLSDYQKGNGSILSVVRN